MRLPNWKFRSVEEEREEDARRLHEAAWPDMFANLQSAYSELTNAQFELERRTSEISETRDLFQQVISSMSEALFLTDRSGRVIRANPAAASLLECQETSILGRPLTAVCGSEEIPATPWKLMEIAPTGRITNLDVDVQTMGGGLIPVSFSLGLMHDKQNKITGVLAVARDMREHRSLINSLVAARTRFQELLEFAPDAIVLANQDGEIVLVNSQAEKILGYKRDELLGASVEMLVPEHLRGQAFEATAVTDDALLSLEDALLSEHASSASEQLEFSLLNRDGHEFPAEIARRQIETEDGVMMMSLIRDITDRKRAEAARHAAETRYQGLFDNANDIVYTNDLQGNFTSMNKMASRLTGYSLEEALRLNTQQVIAPEYLPLVFQRIQAQLGGQTNLSPYDLELICKDGSRAPVEISTRLIFENGQPIGFQGIARDIRERKQAERMQARLNHQAALRADVSTALTDEQGTLRQILQQCSEAIVTHLDAALARIWLLNEPEQILELQASAGLDAHLEGQPARVPVGKFNIGLIAQERAPHLTNDVSNDSRVGDPDWAQREGLTAFAGYPLVVGDRLIGVMALFAKHPLETDTLNALAAIADTIVHGVERKRIEEEREALLAREHEARMSAETANNLKDDFLAMISHELRAPLTAILGWAQMLRGGALDRVSAERALLTIERNAKSQAHLVGDLLDASRISTGKLSLEAKPVELMSVVDAAVDAVRPSVEAKSLRLQITLEPWVGPFTGDAERLKQVVWNLLSNAIKFTPAGGLIEVRLERLEQKALLIVSDTGQGIDPEFIRISSTVSAKPIARPSGGKAA